MDYREETVDGTVKSWRRAYSVTVINAYAQTPTIQFGEEDRTTLPDGRSMVTNNTSVGTALDDPTKAFPILHPITGEVIGQATYQDVYVTLFSLYMALAAERDNPTPVINQGVSDGV